MQPLENIPPLTFAASTPPTAPSSFLKNLWKKICSIVSKIFAAFSNICTSKKIFSAREITFLRDERWKAPPPPPSPLLKNKTVTKEIPSVDASPVISEEPKINQEPPYVSFDSTLENLRLFVREFAVLGINVVYENHIVNHLESAQQFAPSLPPIIKSVAKLLVEIGDKASKPLFRKFAEQKTQTIDPALQKIFKTLLKPDLNDLREKLFKYLIEKLENVVLEKSFSYSDYINPIVNWCSNPELQKESFSELYPKNKNFDCKLIQQLFESACPFWAKQIELEKNNLHHLLQTTLCAEFKDTKAPLKQDIEDNYIQPVMNWLLLSNHTTPLTDLFGVLDPQKEALMDKIFERAITLLVEKKIDQYSHMLEKTMQRRLGDIIHQMMQKNATRIVDFFSERISELIHAMPFTETMDALIHDALHLQIKGIIESESYYDGHKATLEKASQALIEPKNEEELERQIDTQNYLNEVAAYENKEAFLQDMYFKKFNSQPACTPHLKQIFKQEQHLISLGKDPRIVRAASEKALFNAIAENLLDLMTPTKKQFGFNGEVIEIDPFVELWDRLYLPEEFYDLVKQSEELTQEFATTETTVLLEKIKQPVVEIVKNLFKSTTKDLLRKKLGEIVQKGFEKITDPEKLNEIHAEETFPAINALLVEVFAKQTLGRNLKEFIPLFHNLITDGPSEHSHNVRAIQNALIKLAKTQFKQFNPAEFHSNEEKINLIQEMKISELTSVEWLKLTQEIVTDLENSILNARINQIALNPANTTHAEIHDILKKTFNAESDLNDPRFGILSMDLIFKMGKFPNEWLLRKFNYLQTNLSKLITEGIEPWRESYHKLIDTTTEALKRSFLNPQAVKAILSDETVPPPLFTDKKLAHQINITACLAHDIIMGIAQEKGSITAFAAKKIISSTPAEINSVITTIYKKLFGNQLINQNLIVLAYEKVFKSLSEASKNIKIKEEMRAHQLAVGLKN